jgi:uncharacterized membrane protein YjfL (UPF0719 family)
MLEAFIDTLTFFPRGLVYVVLGLVVLVLAKLARDLVTRHEIDEEIVEKGNLAVALRLCGYLLGVILVFLAAVYQPLVQPISDVGLGFTREFGFDLLRVFLYSLAGIVALNLVRPLADRLVLYKFNVEREIVDEQNVGTGAVEFGMNVAAGLIIAGAITGGSVGTEVETALIALAFFALGMVVLVLFALFYELTSSFNIHDEIVRNDTAVGIAFGGNLVAIGLVALKALFGDFVDWQTSIVGFVIFAVFGFVLLYLLRLLVDLILFSKTKVSDQLVAGNIGVAFIESTVVISAALILFFAI